MALTQNPLNKIKDRIYEAEGLLELLHLRPEKLPELAPMILSRLDEARSDFENFTKENSSIDDEPVAEDETMTEDTDIPDDEFISDEETEPEVDSVPDDTPIYEEETEPEVDSVPDDAPIYEDAPDSQEDSFHRTPRPRPALCLNDRYRFRRAIFGGSDAEMNTTLDFVASMDSYGQAEEFFLTDMDLDKENEDVADFLNIIRKYFGE